MSKQNVELVLAALDAYNAGDLDVWQTFLAPDIETFPDASIFPEPGPLLGRDKYRAWTEEIASAWICPRWETREVLAVGSDRVLNRGDWGGEGAASGIETYSSITGVFTVRDSQISRVELYFDHDRALKAAGLRE
jgi:ketosteroid isomerase-like protein